MYRLYPVAYVGTMLGLIIYHIYPATKPKINEDKDNDEQNKEEVKDEVKGETKGEARDKSVETAV